MANDPVTIYSSGTAVWSGDSSYAAVLEAGGNDSITVTSGGVVAETAMGEGTLLVADSGAVISGININDEGAVFSGTEVYCSGAEKWYGPAACATFGSIVLVGGTFTNNVASASGGYLGQGGALEGYEGYINVSGGTYTSNMATGGGGAILGIGGETVIADAEFTKNSATYGGAVEISQEGTAVVTGAAFDRNSAEYGGAVEVHQGASALIADATFTKNTATSGGAVMVDTYAAQKSYLTLTDATFTGNSAEDAGGAVLNDGVLNVSGGDFDKNRVVEGKGGVLYNTGSATVAGAEFTGNAALYGGAIWQGHKKLELVDVAVDGNTAIYGGALYANGSGTTEISGASFSDNSAPYDEDYELGGMGGALYVTAGATVTVTDTTFTNNIAEVNPDDEWDGGCGGAVINYGNFSITSGAFIGNGAYYGGGLYNQAGEGVPMTVTDTDFTGNAAEYGGGAICNCWGELVVTGGEFMGNVVLGRDGGAIANWSVATIDGALFTENSAVKGGALSHTGTTITVDGAVFGNNSAEEGGAFWNMNEWGDSVAELVNCSFTDNTAEAGGAIWNGETLTISGGEFSGNVAEDGKGGALYNSGAAVTSMTNFVENTAIYGGAIWNDDDIEISDAYIAENTAIYGGALYANGSGATVISAASFEGNGAVYDEDYELGGMGGALYVTAGATVTVTDVIFEGNYAEVNPESEWDGGCGGAVINYGNFSVAGGEFIANSAYYGAGLYNQAGAAGVPMIVSGANFTNNSATYGGAAICNCWGELVVSGGVFTSNTVEVSDGGAIANWSVASVADAEFSENTAQYGGAISNSWAQSITVTNTTFSGNSAVYFGGAFVQLNGGEAKFVDCAFTGNTATLGGAIYNDAALYLDGCTFETETDTISNAGSITVVGEITFNATVDNGTDGVFTVLVGDAADSVLVNGWSFITGGSVGFDVSAGAEAGTYLVACGVGEWSGSISLDFDGEASGEAFTVENGTVTTDTVVIGARTYTLANNAGAFMLTIEGDAPAAGATAGDLNGDGRSDVIMSITEVGHGAEGATGAWLIQEDQTAAWGDLSQRNTGWEIFGTGITAAGKATNDVYLKSTGNVVGAWVTGDDGKVTGWETVGEFDDQTQVLGLGDFNGDGQTDLLLRNVNGAVGCYLTEGTGWNYFQSLGDEWKICAVGDLNGDGRSDVVLKHDAGFAGSWLTQSDCTMAWANLDTLPEGFEIVGCGDFDGDGTDDVLLKKDTYYGAWIVEDGNAKSWMGLGDLGGVTVEQIGDFDADGIDDLRIRTSAGDLGAQLVKGADNLQWKYYGSVGAEWSTSLAAI